jgi:hypothetical protein
MSSLLDFSVSFIKAGQWENGIQICDRDRAGKSLKVAFTDGKTQKLNSMHAPLGRFLSDSQLLEECVEVCCELLQIS